MALIQCWGCGHQVSDKEKRCAGCGTPIAKEEPIAAPVETTAGPRDTDNASEQKTPHALSARLAKRLAGLRAKARKSE